MLRNKIKERIINIIKHMGQFIESIVKDSNQLSNTIILAFILLAFVFLIIGTFFKRGEDNKVLKIGGIFLITFLTILSNNIVAYIVAIFINATIIAKLDFLKAIAAIIFRNKDYFEHLTELNKSNKKENIDNKVNEAKQNSETRKNQSEKEIRTNIENSLSDIAVFLKNRGFIKKYNVNDFYRFDLTDNRKIYIDAICSTPSADFVYEVKNIINPSKIYETIRQIENYINIYKEYLNKRGLNRTVKGLLVVPKNIQLGDIFMGKIGIMKYDSEKKAIINIETIEKWMDKQ